MHNSTLFNNLIKTESEVLDLIKKWHSSQNNCLITYINQHCYNLYSKDKDYKNLVDNYFKTYIDGIGIFLAAKLLGYNVRKRFNASDLNERIIQVLIQNNSRVYIIGGNFSAYLIDDLKNRGIKVVGYQKGFYNNAELKNLIPNISSLNADSIIIGMGVPKQEHMAVEISKELRGKLIICVGNFLEFYSGTIKRIPQMFRNLGVEWIFRLIVEPKRLWKRYMIGIPVFFFLILKECLSRGK